MNKMKYKLLNCFILFIILIFAAGIAGCRPSAKLEISPLILSSPAIMSGQAVYVESTVTNSSETAGKLSAILKVDDQVVETTEIMVSANESKKIIFHYEGALTSGKHKVEINGIEADLDILRPAEFQLSALNIGPAEIVPKQSITVSAGIENLGDVEGTYTAEFTVDDRLVETRDIPVKPGAIEKAAFTCAVDSSGTHIFRLGDLSQTVNVFKPAEFTVTDLSLENSEIAAGKSTTVTGKVSNDGEVSGTYTAVLRIDGQGEKTKDILIGPGAAESVTFWVYKNNPGSYQVALGTQTRTLSVFKTQLFLLQHDNNVISESFNESEPVGQWSRFSPPTRPFVLQKVIIGGKRSDFSQPEKKQYTLSIWNKDFTQLLYSADYPYSNFSTKMFMVKHDISPELNIEDDFYVEIVSHPETRPGENESEIALYIGCDFTVADNKNSGYSSHGAISDTYLANDMLDHPKFSAFSWAIRAGGEGKAVQSAAAPSSGEIVINPELQSLVSDASAALSKAESYKFELDMQMPIQVSGGKEGGKEMVTATLKGYLNKVDKEMTTTMKMNIDLSGKKIENISEMYITQGWVYQKLRSDQDWENMELTDELWKSQNEVSFLERDYLESPTSIELVGSVIFDGIDCQVLKIKPDKNTILESLSSEQNMSNYFWADMDASGIKEFTIQEWIAKDTHLPVKEELSFSFEAGPEDLADSAPDLDTMSIELDYTIRLYDYNIAVAISIPPEALKGWD
jgi:hypothetical protein